MYLAALKAFFSCSLVCVVVECSSDIKICSNRLEPVDGVPISACGNLAYLQHQFYCLPRTVFPQSCEEIEQFPSIRETVLNIVNNAVNRPGFHKR